MYRFLLSVGLPVFSTYSQCSGYGFYFDMLRYANLILVRINGFLLSVCHLR